jgi:hypothetical protein
MTFILIGLSECYRCLSVNLEEQIEENLISESQRTIDGGGETVEPDYGFWHYTNNCKTNHRPTRTNGYGVQSSVSTFNVENVGEMATPLTNVAPDVIFAEDSIIQRVTVTRKYFKKTKVG